MGRMKSLLFRFLAIFRREELDAELDEELAFHLEMERQENLRRGMSEAQAWRAARLSLGGLEKTKGAYRDQRGLPAFEALLQDLRYSLRTLWRAPGFTALAVMTLALGIGATTAIFTILNALVLAPMPYPRPLELAQVWETWRYQEHSGYGAVSLPNARDWREQNDVFAALGAYHRASFNLTVNERPTRLSGARLEPDVFRALGVEPLYGRTFGGEESVAGRDRVVVLGHGLWTEHLGADPEAVGSTLRLDGVDHVVVGVMPPGFRFPPRSDAALWTPLVVTPTFDEREARGTHWLRVVARLKPGVSFLAAQRNMDAVAAALEELYPDEQHGRGASVEPLHAAAVAGTARVLLLLLGAVSFVLLIACANVANMVLAHATHRRRELALRLSLGAGHLRIVRQMLLETGCLAAGGALLGLLFARAGLSVLRVLPGNPIPAGQGVEMSVGVLVFCVLTALATALLAGLLPALRIGRLNLQETLSDPGAAPGRSVRRSRSGWIVSEVALALVLLVGAVLMAESLRRMTRIELGFDPMNVLTLRLDLPESKYGDAERVVFYDQLLERVRALPGVRSAGLISVLPVQSWGSNGAFSIDGFEPWESEKWRVIEHRVISPGYFETMGIPVVRGRSVTPRDGRGAPRAVLVNQRAGERYFRGEDPIGHRLALGTVVPEENWGTVVGIVGDVRSAGPQRPAMTEMYEVYWRFPLPSMSLVVRSERDPETIAGAVHRAVLEIDPDQPVHAVATMEDVVSRSVAATRFISRLLGAASVLALALALVGVYAVIAYLVERRTHEVGLRMALGARRDAVLRLVLAAALRPAASGVVLGVFLALALSRFLRRFVIGILPTDPLIYAAAAVLMLAAVIAAAFLPARRAAGIDPAVALRHD